MLTYVNVKKDTCIYCYHRAFMYGYIYMCLFLLLLLHLNQNRINVKDIYSVLASCQWNLSLYFIYGFTHTLYSLYIIHTYIGTLYRHFHGLQQRWHLSHKYYYFNGFIIQIYSKIIFSYIDLQCVEGILLYKIRYT